MEPAIPSKLEDFEKEYSDLSSRFEALEPELEVTVSDPTTGMKGFAVVWNTIKTSECPLGQIGKGGTRITPTVTLDEIRMLAKIMALKVAAAGLPIGGSKSGLVADPDSPGFEKVYRSYVRAIKPLLAENGGKFGGFGFDIGARPIHPVWACDELKSTRCFTGKPVEMGGTDYDKEGIAGLGVSVAADTIVRLNNIDPKTLTFSVQGLGAMGAAVVKYFSESGAKLTYVSDLRIGGSFKLNEHSQEEAVSLIKASNLEKLNEFLNSKAEKIGDVNAILFEKTDVLFPCAVQDVISISNVEKILAKYVIEGANNPTSAEAQQKMFEKGIVNIPDFIANPGGSIAAYVEMTSTISPEENARTRKNVNDAKDLTRSKIKANVTLLHELVKNCNVNPTKAGRYLALRKIFS